MDVTTPAAAAVTQIEQHGLLGAVVLFASLAIAGLGAAVLVLWRANSRLQEQLDKTSQWALGEVAKNVEINRMVSSIRSQGQSDEQKA